MRTPRLFAIFVFIVTLQLHSIKIKAQDEFLVTGQVTDATTGEALPGVNVLLVGTSQGTVTDLDGNYSIDANSPLDSLKFSFIGYTTEVIPINNRNSIDITLSTDVTELQEVVVVGYGVQRKSDVTGSVASVEGEELTNVVAANPMQALQGRVAGVQISSQSGTPGEDPVVRIRGVGTFNDAAPLFVVDGMFFDNINFLNTQDIQSIEVLKDASSTAIYGSRGANGVIIITTKKATEGETDIRIGAEYGYQTLQQRIDLLNGPQFARLVNDINPGTYNNIDILPNTDWQDQVLEDLAPIQNYQLSISGRSENIGYYISGNAFLQEGIVPKSAFNRYSLKLNNFYQPLSFLELGHNLTVTRFVRDNAPGVISTAYRAWPIHAPYTDVGDFFPVQPANPMATINYHNNQDQGWRTAGNFYAEATFLEQFRFKSSWGYNFENRENTVFNPVFSVSPIQENPENDLSVQNLEVRDWVWENTLHYDLELPDHRLGLLAGFTMQENRQNEVRQFIESLVREDPRFWNFKAGDPSTVVLENVGDAPFKSTLLSYLFRVNYTWQEKYLLTASFRADGSSKFGENNRYGYFPSAALGWRLSEEAFLSDFSQLSNLKLRISWGQIGNQKIPGREQFSLIVPRESVFGQPEELVQGLTPDRTGNPDLKWETTTSSNIGLEYGFFSNRLFGELDYYYRESSDILVPLYTPGHFGNGFGTRITFNAADVRNSGFEFTVNWRDEKGDFSYSVGLLGSTVNNEVTGMGSATGNNSFLISGSLGNGQTVTRTQVGKPIGYFYGYNVLGVFEDENALDGYPHLDNAEPGDLKFEDVNGDGEISAEDRTSLGSYIPDLSYGFNFNLKYKQVDISANFTGQMGSEIYNGKNAVRFDLLNYESDMINRWTPNNRTTSIPRATQAGINYLPSSRFVHDGSFFKLQTLTIGFNLPPEFLQDAGINTARLYLRGNNVFQLFDYNGYTTEVASNDVLSSGIDLGVYPIPAIYTLGLNVGF